MWLVEQGFRNQPFLLFLGEKLLAGLGGGRKKQFCRRLVS
jgi:hypothetical protein